jgi:hypothetical protein
MSKVLCNVALRALGSRNIYSQRCRIDSKLGALEDTIRGTTNDNWICMPRAIQIVVQKKRPREIKSELAAAPSAVDVLAYLGASVYPDFCDTEAREI